MNSPTEPWLSPTAHSALDATVEIPGSKSLTNRYLVLAALAASPVSVYGGLDSRDSYLMRNALRALGVHIEDSTSPWKITPAALSGGSRIDCGLAGTVMRFIPPLVLLADSPVTFDGDKEARVRPMGPLLEALRRLGAVVDDGGRGTLPFTVEPPEKIPSSVTVDASLSSQFVSGLLLCAPALPNGLTIYHEGRSLPSRPHVDMTCAVLRECGVNVTTPDDHTWVVPPTPLQINSVSVEPDLSNAGPFVAAALIAGGTVRIPHWPEETTQPGLLLPSILEKMGGKASRNGDILTMRGNGRILPIDVDLTPAGELTPTIAALCVLAEGPSTITGIGHLRGHETDRLAAIITEVRRLGGQCTATDDALHFEGLPAQGLRAATLESYADHRMATFGALIGLAVPGVRVTNINTTAKTLPNFPAMWAAMLADGDQENN